MKLADWRKREGLSCDDIARRLEITAVRGGSSVWNWETGRARADADIIDRIEILTKGEVSPLDMHRTRLDWLRQNRSDEAA
ncbi:transcriptional regulator with XRE-family HTH domain [Ochrobactrum daejeonense]|uniref:Transcriptional regulator with XRE-family HTH domain n=1 Tax=Brucella daejeonensis TaxID=659015 RepID=A0A7W9ENX4_9HYPH|nr:hypothetical protein [Brucella daejeonensis]MBB5703575.1 transcriptional regulator with XRE-family HTH domain [Brucella daejeonensis]NKB79837.1 helix-turn-helix domain-containing protein [Brucella daejeonensis]